MAISELHKVAKFLKKGQEIEPVTTRDLLSWFDAQRRGPNIVAAIREQLAELKIRTIPDFQSAYIDGEIGFEFDTDDQVDEFNENYSTGEIVEQITDSVLAPMSTWTSRDATYRISKLKAANQSIVSVDPSDPLEKAILQMMEGGYSQLPVMTGDFNVKGIITWKSIGCALGLGRKSGPVREFMEAHHEIRADLSIFDAIPTVVSQDYVLVRGSSNRITGIITASDLSLQFRTLTEPFLLLSEIENLIRNMIGDKFTIEELATARDSSSTKREIGNIADLTFGEYIRLIEDPKRWSRLALAVDRKVFCEKLDKVRDIRNGVMHFDPDGIAEEDLENLRKFTNLLKQIEKYL